MSDPLLMMLFLMGNWSLAVLHPVHQPVLVAAIVYLIRGVGVGTIDAQVHSLRSS